MLFQKIAISFKLLCESLGPKFCVMQDMSPSGDTGWIPGLERYPEEGNGYPL